MHRLTGGELDERRWQGFVRRYGPELVDVLDELAQHQSTPERGQMITRMLVDLDLAEVRYCQDAGAFYRTERFPEFYAWFSQTPMYRALDAERSRRAKA